jgi:hypothetical protein
MGFLNTVIGCTGRATPPPIRRPGLRGRHFGGAAVVKKSDQVIVAPLRTFRFPAGALWEKARINTVAVGSGLNEIAQHVKYPALTIRDQFNFRRQTRMGPPIKGEKKPVEANLSAKRD